MRPFASLLLLLLAASSSACLNDSDTRSTENEFNSAYGGKTTVIGRVFQPTALLILAPPLLLLGFGCWWKVREGRQLRETAQRRAQRRHASRTPA